MEENLKKELISSLSQKLGYEKAEEIIDSVEYVDYLNDEKINTLIEFYYNVNTSLNTENNLLRQKSMILLSLIDKKDKYTKIFFISLISLFSFLFFLIIKKWLLYEVYKMFLIFSILYVYTSLIIYSIIKL